MAQLWNFKLPCFKFQRPKGTKKTWT
jgi:hypothetical protein